eukprot:gene3802-4327_t
MKSTFLSCLKPIKDDGIVTAVLSDPETKLVAMNTVQQEACQLLHSLFAFGFANHAPFEAFLDETKAISLLYTDEVMYGKAGNVAMTAFDIALSMGGSEAIVQSYSVMDSQREVRQNHTTLEDRAILDWATSNVVNSEGIISVATKFYIDRVQSLHLPRQREGTLKRKTSSSFKASQVLRLTLIMDLNRKVCLELKVKDVQLPAEYDKCHADYVNCKSFWEEVVGSVAMQGFAKNVRNMPVLQPDLLRWAPFISKRSRKGPLLINLEHRKMRQEDGELESNFREVTEQRF